MRPGQRREMVKFLQVTFNVSVRHACCALRVQCSVIRYTLLADDQAALRSA